jgi:hypothetical protein
MKLPAMLTDEADALREWRNRKYQGFFSAIETARKYVEATSAWVKREQAQLLK